MLDARWARTLYDELNCTSTDSGKRIGVLNFASTKNPGGGFQTGAQAQVRLLCLLFAQVDIETPKNLQEESIARSSTIYPSLMTDTAQQFYKTHRKNLGEGYYSHAMIFSPLVLLMRTDNGSGMNPLKSTSLRAALSRGIVRRYLRAHQSRIDNDNESSLDVAMKPEQNGSSAYSKSRV